MKEIWLNIDSKVKIARSDSPQRIFIINPEKLSNTSADKLWNQISSSMGKYEFEMWLAEEIIAITMQTMAEGRQIADLTPIAGSSMYINYDFPEAKWKKFMSNECFRNILKNLPGFRVNNETEKEVILEYVAK